MPQQVQAKSAALPRLSLRHLAPGDLRRKKGKGQTLELTQLSNPHRLSYLCAATVASAAAPPPPPPPTTTTTTTTN
eukprot:1158635-Pelagomonas_calceolata.AAC.8